MRRQAKGLPLINTDDTDQHGTPKARTYRGFARMNADQKKLPEAPKLPKIAEIEKQQPTRGRGDAEKRQIHQMWQVESRHSLV
jgi:hypothetical protein